MNYIIYCAHGKQEYYNEVVYSIMSLYLCTDFKSFENIKIVICTDNEEIFKENLGEVSEIVYIPITSDKISEMNSNGYVYRAKIVILLDFARNHEGNYLFVDSDTFFLGQSLQTLFQEIESNGLYMYALENTLSQRIVNNIKIIFDENDQNNELAFLSELNKNSLITDSGMEYNIPMSTEMWNSGVIGFNFQNSFLLNEALELTDTIYSKFPYRLAEQLALSYVYGKTQTIKNADFVIHHYWYSKITRYILAVYFAQEVNLAIDRPTFSRYAQELAKYEKCYFEEDIKKYQMKEIYSLESQKIEFSNILPKGISILRYFWNMELLHELSPKESYFGKMLRN